MEKLFNKKFRLIEGYKFVVVILRGVVDKVYVNVWEVKKRGELVGWSLFKFFIEFVKVFDLNVVYFENYVVLIVVKKDGLRFC